MASSERDERIHERPILLGDLQGLTAQGLAVGTPVRGRTSVGTSVGWGVPSGAGGSVGWKPGSG